MNFWRIKNISKERFQINLRMIFFRMRIHAEISVKISSRILGEIYDEFPRNKMKSFLKYPKEFLEKLLKECLFCAYSGICESCGISDGIFNGIF